MHLICGIRKLLGSIPQVSALWLIAGVFLFAWVFVYGSIEIWAGVFDLSEVWGRLCGSFDIWGRACNSNGIWGGVLASIYITFSIEYCYMLSLPTVFALRGALVGALTAVAERIARSRLRAAGPHYENANSFLEKSSLDLALAEYDLICSIDPDNARAYIGRGRVHELVGEHDLAITDYTAAININSFIRGLPHRKSLGEDAGKYDLAWAYYYRGCSYQSKGAVDLARGDFSSATSTGSIGFPKALANAGFLRALSDSYAQGVRSGLPEDAATVHYVKPCGAARKNKGQNFLYSELYLAVNCTVCLESRPEKNALRNTLGSPASRAIYPCMLLVSPIPGWIIIENLLEGQLFPWLAMLLLVPIACAALWTDVLWEFMTAVARPWASRNLSKPSNEISSERRSW